MVYMNFIFRITLALILSGLIGLERQKRQRLAGIRTNVLVALGSFLFVTMSMTIEGEASPTRMAAQVISGIGFLGAGVIMRDGLNVRGLNTAATLWCSAAIGVLISSGLILEAIIGTVYILVANVYLRILIRKFGRIAPVVDDDNEIIYAIRVVCSSKEEFHIRSLLVHMFQFEELHLTNLDSESVDTTDLVEVIARVSSAKKNHNILEKVAGRIGLESGITSVGWEVE